MRLNAISVVITVLLVCSVGCQRGEEPRDAPAAASRTATLSPPKPLAKPELRTWSEPAVTTETYRRMFNEVASELSDLQWSADRGVLGEPEVEEITIPAGARERYGQPPTGPLQRTPQLSRMIELIEERLEAKRVDAVERSLAVEAPVHLTFDRASLSKSARAAAAILAEAGVQIEALYRLQNHPDAPAFAKQLIEVGDAPSLAFFKRAAGPTAVRFGAHPYANALASFPDTMVGLIMWPAGMDQAVFDEIAKRAEGPEGKGFLSPFTVVKRTEAGELIWMPDAAYPPFQEPLRALARRLEEAAAVSGLDEKLARQLALQGKAMLAKEPMPFDASDAAWTEAEAELEVIVGPYETARDPYRTKAFYQFVLGRTDPAGMELAARIEALLPRIEEGMAAFLPALSEQRPRNRLRAIEVIQANGFAAGEEGPDLAVILPNVGPAAAPGRRKLVVMTNHHAAKLPLMKRIAEAALTPDAPPFLALEPFVALTMLEAIMYPLGETEAAQALGAMRSPLVRIKAAAAAAWAARALREAGIFGAAQLQGFYVAHITNLVRHLREGTGNPAGAAALAELAYLSWHGALAMKGGRIAIDYDRIHGVLRRLLADAMGALENGDADAAAELLVTYPRRAPEGLGGILDRLAAAAIPMDVAVSYHVR